MKQITDYIFASAANTDVATLQKKVKEKLADGYQPWGSVFTIVVGNAKHLHQTMVKVSEAK